MGTAAGETFERRAIEDPFVGLTAKHYVTIEESIDLCQTIGRRVSGLSPRPDLAIGLANGGILPAVAAAQAAGIECRIVRVRRRSSRLKQRIGFLRRVLRLPPGLLAWGPINFVSRRFDSIFNQVESDGAGGYFEFDVTDRHIVIVDDCVDTGSSVAHVRAKLLANGAASVRIAVISWATKYDSQAMYGVTPDIHLHRIIHYYPWALNNPDYDRFKAWLNEQGHQLWT